MQITSCVCFLKKIALCEPCLFIFFFILKEAWWKELGVFYHVSNSNPLLNEPHHSLFYKLSKLYLKTYFPAIRPHSNVFL